MGFQLQPMRLYRYKIRRERKERENFGSQWGKSKTRGWQEEHKLGQKRATFILCFHSYLITYGVCKNFDWQIFILGIILKNNLFEKCIF